MCVLETVLALFLSIVRFGQFRWGFPTLNKSFVKGILPPHRLPASVLLFSMFSLSLGLRLVVAPWVRINNSHTASFRRSRAALPLPHHTLRRTKQLQLPIYGRQVVVAEFSSRAARESKLTGQYI